MRAEPEAAPESGLTDEPAATSHVLDNDQNEGLDGQHLQHQDEQGGTGG